MQEESLESQIRTMYRLYHRDVYQFLLYFTGERTEAEDLTQEVFLRVLRALPHFEQRSSVKTWLLSIAKYVATDHHRRRRRLTFLPDALISRFRARDGLPEQELAEKESWQVLESALQQLKPQYRIVVILRNVKELSVRETADVLGCSEGKVKVDHHRALKMLHEQLSPYWKGEMWNELANSSS